MVHVALAGGGTAGHLFPSLAVAQRVRDLDPGAELLFIGSRHGMDRELLGEMGLPHILLGAQPFPYRPSPAMVKSLAALAGSVVAARRALRRFRPDVLFASGGYVAAPAVLAARTLGVPCVIHAGDALPDRTNRLLSRYATRITLAFKASAAYFPAEKTLFTGAPLRKEVFAHTREEGLARFGLDPSRKTLLVTGGSQGAQPINQALMDALGQLVARPDLQIVHLTGPHKYEQVAARVRELGIGAPGYQALTFFAEMGLAYAATDLILSRAGSSSLGEGLALGKPMIVVPYPHAGGHQMENARPLGEAGAVLIIRDENLSGQTLTDAICGLLDAPQKLAAMAAASRSLGRPDAAEVIARLLLEITGA